MDGNKGLVGPRHLYGAWWLLALIPVAYEVLAWMNRDAATPPRQQAWAGLVNSYFALPYLSLITHIGILHYVYDVRFYGAHAAPILIGLTLVLNRVSPTALIPRKDLLALRLLLPLAALFVSMNNPFTLYVHKSWPIFAITPLNVAILATFITYVYCFLWNYKKLFLATGVVSATCYVLGPSRVQIHAWFTKAWDWSSSTAERIVPKTPSEWGVVGLVASFILLGIGFWVSLRKQPQRAVE